MVHGRYRPARHSARSVRLDASRPCGKASRRVLDRHAAAGPCAEWRLGLVETPAVALGEFYADQPLQIAPVDLLAFFLRKPKLVQDADGLADIHGAALRIERAIGWREHSCENRKL